MTESALCVCGHLVSIHTLMHGADRGCTGNIALPDGVTAWCPCHQCRPKLVWPDEPGNWWCLLRDYGIRLAHVSYSRDHDLIVLPCVLGAFWSNRTHFEREYGPARFVKIDDPFPERKGA